MAIRSQAVYSVGMQSLAENLVGDEESLNELATTRSAQVNGTSEDQSDDYHIALVPLLPDRPTSHKQLQRNSRFLLLPLTWKELLTQVREQSRGSSAESESRIFRFGEVCVDFISMEVRRRGRLVNLTAMEFKVLKYFLLNPNRVISRDDLLNQVWGYNQYPCTRTVDNHVLRLRQKLEAEFANPVHFRTVHRFGYKFLP